MPIFTVGLLILVVGAIAAIAHRLLGQNPEQRMLILGGGILAVLVGLGTVAWSTAIYVDNDKTGVVIVKFGSDLPVGNIVATKGEKGPQAKVLPPGWHFFYWPWIYELKAMPIIDVPKGSVGVVEAFDGNALPSGEVFAPEWEDPKEMLKAESFLDGGKGFRGPQLTVLQPAKYRYNTELFRIDIRKALEVSVGEVAVIKANAGPLYSPPEGQKVVEVNGTPIVPKGYRGIWSEALTPNAYYLHPEAYVVTRVQTTNRIYEYAFDEAITVRTRDGFEFGVDVRVSVKISATNAPFVVAQLADPDRREGKFQALEQLVILPSVRAIFRNTAESRNALEFVNQRSTIEELATQKLQEGLSEYRVETDGVFIADIRIGETEAGRSLLSTQTDREVALQQQETFREKERAQQARSAAVRAEEDANQQVRMAAARAGVSVAEENAKALVAQAVGEAESYRKKMEALGGVQNFIALEIANLALEKWEGQVPKVFTVGGTGVEGDPTKALMGVFLQQAIEAEEAAAKAKAAR